MSEFSAWTGPAVTALLDRAAEADEPCVRVWIPPRGVSFGPRDRRAEGYAAARQVASARGFPPTDRAVGGRAVACTGSTVAFARAEPASDTHAGIERRYERFAGEIRTVLRGLDVPVRRGEPPKSFCPGGHSLQCEGKVVGFAQRVGQNAAAVVGLLVVEGHGELADVLAAVYEELGIPFRPRSVGSLARAGGITDAECVAARLYGALQSNPDTR